MNIPVQTLGKISPDWRGWTTLLILINLLIKTYPLLQGIMIHPDAPVYLWSAQSLADGNWQDAILEYSMFFYPMLITLVHYLIPDWLAAGRFISVTASVLAVVPFFALARRCSPGWPAIWVSLIFIFIPELNTIGFAAIRDPLFLCLVLTCLFTTVRFIETGRLYWLLLILFFIVSLPLLRVEGFLISPIVLLWCIGHIFISRPRSPQKKLQIIFIFLFIGIILFLNYKYNSLLTLTRYNNIAQLLNNNLVNSAPAAYSVILDFLETLKKSAPYSSFGNNFWQTLIRNWQIIFVIGMVSVLIELMSLPLLLLGMSGLKRLWNLNNIGPLLTSVLLLYTMGSYCFYIYFGMLEDRFLLLPAILLLFSVGLMIEPFTEWVGHKLRLSKKLRIHSPQLITGLAIILLLFPIRESIRLKHRIHIPVQREAGLWARDLIASNEPSIWRVAVNTRRLQWYTDRKDAFIFYNMDFEKTNQWLSQTNRPSIEVFVITKNQYNESNAYINKAIKTNNWNCKTFEKEKSKFIALVIWKGSKNRNRSG